MTDPQPFQGFTAQRASQGLSDQLTTPIRRAVPFFALGSTDSTADPSRLTSPLQPIPMRYSPNNPFTQFYLPVLDTHPGASPTRVHTCLAILGPPTLGQRCTYRTRSGRTYGPASDLCSCSQYPSDWPGLGLCHRPTRSNAPAAGIGSDKVYE